MKKDSSTYQRIDTLSLKRGFTLIELILAMALSSFIFLTVSTLLVTIITSNTKGRFQESFEQTKNDVVVELSNTMRWAKNIDCTQCAHPTSPSISIDEIVYSLDNQRIKKGGDYITPQNIRITQWRIKEYSGATQPSIEMFMELKIGSNASQTDTMTFVVSNRRQTISL